MKYLLIYWGVGFVLTACYVCYNWFEWKRREGKNDLDHEVKAQIFGG